MRLTLPLVAILAGISCGEQDPTLEIDVFHGDSYWVTWPPDQDSVRVQVVNDLYDPKGLAGLELRIAGDLPTETLTAADFAAPRNPFFIVPDVGTAILTVSLAQDGQVVAGGTEEWSLESEVEWALHVSRAPYCQSNGGFNEDPENPKCLWFWCHRAWRFPIMEEFANYEDEALWVTLFRVHPDECQDVCRGFW